MIIDTGALRGLDAHQAAKDDLATHLQELETAANGQAMNDETLADFEETFGEKQRLQGIIDQLGVRQAAIEESLKDARSVEKPESAFAGITVRKATPDNIFDLAEYRTRVSSIDELPRAYRDGALRVLDTVTFPTATDQSKAHDQVAQLIEKHRDEGNGIVSRRVIETGSPVYAEAWGNYITRRGLTPRMQAALQTYVDADGGFAIPFTIDPTFLNTSDGAVNPLRQIARVETITTKNWQAITTAGVTAAYIGERTTTGAADSAPTDLDNPTATPVRADVAVDVTLEYLADYGSAAISAEIGRLIADAKDVLEADEFVMGDGSGNPDGVVAALITDTTSIVLTATDNVFVLADIDLLIGSLPPRFRSRARASFLANLAILQLIPPFGTAGQPGNSIYDPLASTLRGYRAYEASAMDDVATDAKEILLFGDFKAGFVIVDRVGLSTRVLDGFDTNGRPTGNSVIYASWRNTSKLLFPNAFRLLKVR
jgi:HK97 family phage major capsid protein